MSETQIASAVINGKHMYNVTPHPITFGIGDDETMQLPTSGLILNARTEEVPLGDDLVTTKFVPMDDGLDMIAAIKADHAAHESSDLPLRIVGSMIAAQAYRGDVVAVTPMKGYERVAPAQKRMNPDKFTVLI